MTEYPISLTGDKLDEQAEQLDRLALRSEATGALKSARFWAKEAAAFLDEAGDTEAYKSAQMAMSALDDSRDALADKAGAP